MKHYSTGSFFAPRMYMCVLISTPRLANLSEVSSWGRGVQERDARICATG